jgi:thiol-disulfide isomerase/thioredoxin
LQEAFLEVFLKKMRSAILYLFLFATSFLFSQSVTKVYKIDELLQRIESEKQTLVVNFWATWCKPCIAELPAFDSLQTADPSIKVLLVTLDFKDELEAKVNPFLQKHSVKAECVLLDEVNGNDFINKISKDWTGAIPATLIKGEKGKKLVEKKLDLKKLQAELASIKTSGK